MSKSEKRKEVTILSLVGVTRTSFHSQVTNPILSQLPIYYSLDLEELAGGRELSMLSTKKLRDCL